MKSNFIKYISFVLVAIGLWSCKKDGTDLVANVSPAGTLTASTTTLNLSLAAAASPAVTFTFPAPVVTGVIVPVTSTIQIDLKGRNFANPKETVIAGTTYSPTVAAINTILLNLDQKAGTPAELEVRLKSAPSPNAVTYSNVITLKATAYSAFSWIYAPGAYQGWEPKTADSLVSAESNGIYTGIITFPTDKLEFKITPVKTWDLSYGVLAELLSSAGNAANLTAPKTGPQLITIDMNSKKFKFEDSNLWALTGSATPLGWGSDIDMKFINDGKGTYKVTANLLAGELKFRANRAYDLNYGGSGGNLVFNGPGNIPVAEAGNYTVTLDITNLKYSLVKN